MRTYFQLFIERGAFLISTITKSIDGSHTKADVKRIALCDQHCRELMDQGWTLDLWSVRHYVVSNQPIES